MSEVERLAIELAWLCDVLALEGDMPTGNLRLDELVMDPVRTRIQQKFLAGDMAEEPISGAIYDLAKDGHVDALAELAIEMLRHRDDRGVWS
jgi:hypothetical protein